MHINCMKANYPFYETFIVIAMPKAIRVSLVHTHKKKPFNRKHASKSTTQMSSDSLHYIYFNNIFWDDYNLNFVWVCVYVWACMYCMCVIWAYMCFVVYKFWSQMFPVFWVCMCVCARVRACVCVRKDGPKCVYVYSTCIWINALLVYHTLYYH